MTAARRASTRTGVGAGAGGRASRCVDGGPFTTVQDLPGPRRLLARRRAAERADGRPRRTASPTASSATPSGAAALELTGGGPDAALHRPTRSSRSAGAAMAIDGRRRAGAAVDAGRGRRPARRVRVGAVDGPGLRATLAVRGGHRRRAATSAAASTFTLGSFGGHDGRRAARRRRARRSATDVGAAPPAAAAAGHGAARSATTGRSACSSARTPRPSSSRPTGSTTLLRAEWEVHFNSARTGVRLVGPRPRWARADGGEAGLHPSNIHDTGYAIGAVDLTGDMPVILGPDGPSLGGFVCPAVVAARRAVEARPAGARATACGSCRGRRRRRQPADDRRRAWLGRATRPDRAARPARRGTRAGALGAGRDDGVLARREPDGDHARR